MTKPPDEKAIRTICDELDRMRKAACVDRAGTDMWLSCVTTELLMMLGRERPEIVPEVLGFLVSGVKLIQDCERPRGGVH